MRSVQCYHHRIQNINILFDVTSLSIDNLLQTLGACSRRVTNETPVWHSVYAGGGYIECIVGISFPIL